MFKDKKILIIIIARGGSKRLPNKNIRKIAGKPLIGHVVHAALGSKYADRIIVSTDSVEIARQAKRYGAEVPFMRPANLASDRAPAVPVLQHAVNFCIGTGFDPDLVIMLKPTSPLVTAEDIDNSIEKMIKDKAESCFSACAIGERPEWMYQIKNGKPAMFINNMSAIKTRSQDFPELYRINGAVYVMTKKQIMDRAQFIGAKPSMYIMPRERSIDIDDHIDFIFADTLLTKWKKNENQRN